MQGLLHSSVMGEATRAISLRLASSRIEQLKARASPFPGPSQVLRAS